MEGKDWHGLSEAGDPGQVRRNVESRKGPHPTSTERDLRGIAKA